MAFPTREGGFCSHRASFQWGGFLAVNLAGEADTIGAVAGGIAGAAWGRQALPARWLAVLHQREYIERTAAQLCHRRDREEITGKRG